NQLAHRANSTGMAGQQSVDDMTRIAKEVWHEIKENY
ncbi:MAG: plasmid mobilization relaxosome protein MobC, partial [Gemmiger sp.]